MLMVMADPINGIQTFVAGRCLSARLCVTLLDVTSMVALANAMIYL
jgi:hypothetical protein